MIERDHYTDLDHCDQCGNEIKKLPIVDGPYYFCSERCQGKWEDEHKDEEQEDIDPIDL